MSSSDRLLFRPSVPNIAIVDSEQYKNDLTDIFTGILEEIKRYGYPFAWLKCNTYIFTCLNPPEFNSGWLKGWLCLQNDTFDYNELGTWYASGVNEAFVGSVYIKDNKVQIKWVEIAAFHITF